MKLKSLYLAAFVLTACSGAVRGAVPPAGYQIVNQSRAEYVLGPAILVSYSNPATTVVSPIYAVRLSPAGTVFSPAFILQGGSGDTLYCGFVLKNEGNAVDSIALDHSAVQPSAFFPEDVFFFRDVNSNGSPDPGEGDPSLFVLAAGDSVDCDVGVVLPDSSSGRDAYQRVAATSTGDPSVADRSMVKISFVDALTTMLFIGPDGNPKALPLGEGSVDDRTRIVPLASQTSVVFTNEILNANPIDDIVELSVPKAVSLAPGLTLSMQDTSGAPIPRSPLNGENYLLGVIPGGASRKVKIVVSSAGEPIHSLLGSTLSIPIEVRSLADTTRTNSTLDVIDLDASAVAPAVLALEQTFRRSYASAGDIVSLVVKVKNISDSVRVDSVVVRESYQKALSFLGSPDFSPEGGSLVWPLGVIGPGEERVTSIRFTCNGRVLRGKAKAMGSADGVSQYGYPAHAGPVLSILAIENDVFADEGIVFGDVFIDENRNGSRDEGEEGVPGATIYTESGEYVFSDSLGKFTLPRVFAGYRIVRLDPASLPPDLEMIRGRDALMGSPGARMVHLLAGGNAAVSFALLRREKPVRRIVVARSVDCQEKVSIAKRFKSVVRALTVPSSHFEIGKAYLKDSPVERLRDVTPYIMSHPGWLVFVEGHTDSVPIHTKRFPSNYELSVARAEAVKRFLAANGVPAERIITRGYGESRPAASNATPEGRRLNRRVEVNLLPPGVDVGRYDSLERVDLRSDLLDTLQVKILWNLATNSEDRFDCSFDLQVPPALVVESVRVRHDGGEIARGPGGAWSVENFTKSSGIDVEIELLAARGDSSAIGDVRGELFLARTGGRDRVGGAVDSEPAPERVQLSPFAWGNSLDSTRTGTIVQWNEHVTPPAPAEVVRNRTAEEGSAKGAGESPVEEDRATGARGGSEDALRRGRKGVAILHPRDGAVLSRKDRLRVQAVVPLGSRYELECNGRVVPKDLIGEKRIDIPAREERATWYGVKLSGGWNRIVLRAKTADGRELADSIRVALAGKPVSLACTTGRILVPADGRSRGVARFAARDLHDLPIVDGMEATIVEGDSLAAGEDARPDRKGFQVTSKDGYFVVELKPSRRTGSRRLSLELDGIVSSCVVAYVPPGRSFFMAGIAQARLGAFSKSGRGEPVGLENFRNGFGLEGNSRLFLQGKTYGGMNLTVRVDSRKRYKDELLKTLNPSRSYSFYGDASEVHYTAPSRGGNYVALEKGESFVRYGDFKTSFDRGEFLRYQRAFTGVDAMLRNGDRVFKGFLTQTDFSTWKDEIPADGTSGYYYLRRSPVVENSERIILETRDRYAHEKVLEVTPMIQNRDYTINYFDGSILFKEPVSATDEDFNPVYIVAIYEVSGRETGEKAHYLYGASGSMARKGIGGLQLTAVARDGSGKGYTLYGARGGVGRGGLGIGFEVARSEDEIAGKGNAFKVSGDASSGSAKLSAYYRRIDGDFLNPSFTGAARELASIKAGFKAEVGLGGDLSLHSTGYKHTFFGSGEKRDNVDAFLDYKHKGLLLGAGMRKAGEKRNSAYRSGVLAVLRGGVEKKIMSFESSWEKNLGTESVEDYPDRLRSVLAFKPVDRIRVVLNHEYLTSSSRGASHQVQAGVESKVGRSGTAYAKYSMDRTASDERVGAVTGLKRKFKLARDVSADFSIENFKSLSSSKGNDYFAFRAGLGKLKKNSHLIEGQYEYRWQRRSSKHLLRVNCVGQFGDGMSLLLKNDFSFLDSDAGKDAISANGRIVFARRPLRSRVQSIFMLRNMYDRFSPIDPEAITWKIVFSSDLNAKPVTPLEIRCKYAVKYVEDYVMGLSESGRTQLLLSQFIYRFLGVYDVDLWGRVLVQSRGGVGTGTGLEVGRLFMRSIRVAAGYSVNGFEDRDMAENDAWARGFGLRVQLVLTESLLGELGGLGRRSPVEQDR